jgi:hypothetical protein
MSSQGQEDFWLELALLKERYLDAYQEHVVSPVRNELLRIEARLKMEREGISGDDAAAVDKKSAVIRKSLDLLDAEVVRMHGMTLRESVLPSP